MFEMTVRTPGLTWVRVASNVTDAIAFLKTASLPGCEIVVRDRHGAPVVLDLVAGPADAAEDELPLAA